MRDRPSFTGVNLTRLYAALVYVCALVLAFFAGVVSQTHAALAADYMLLAVLAFAASAPFIWRRYLSAMIAALLAAIAVAVFFLYQETRTAAVALAVPSIFAALTIAAMVTVRKAPQSDTVRGGGAAAVYGACTYLYGIALAYFVPTDYAGRMLSMGPPGLSAYALLLGCAFGALSIAIWHGNVWAMIATFTIAFVHWLLLAGLHASFWTDATYWMAPAVFGSLTVVVIATAARAR